MNYQKKNEDYKNMYDVRKICKLPDPNLFNITFGKENGKVSFIFTVGKNTIKALDNSMLLGRYLGSLTPFGSVITIFFEIPSIDHVFTIFCGLNMGDPQTLEMVEKLSTQTKIKFHFVDESGYLVNTKNLPHGADQQMRLKTYIQEGIKHNASLSSLDFGKASDYIQGHTGKRVNLN